MKKININLAQYKNFTKYQLEEISLGFEHGLSSEQVEVYAKPEYNRYQMCQLRVGFENGLSQEQIAVYASTKYSEAQMSELRVASELGMSSEEISELAHPELTWQEMWRKRTNMRESAAAHVSLGDVIKSAESRKTDSNAPVHYKQEGFEL